MGNLLKIVFFSALKSWRVSESFISLGKISHIFGARNDLDSALYLNDLTFVSLEIHLREDHKCIDVAEKLWRKFLYNFYMFLLLKVLCLYDILLKSYLYWAVHWMMTSYHLMFLYYGTSILEGSKQVGTQQKLSWYFSFY